MQFIGSRELTFTHPIQHRLDRVREGNDVIETEESGRALYRVGSPEDGVNRFRVLLAVRECEQRAIPFRPAARATPR